MNRKREEEIEREARSARLALERLKDHVWDVPPSDPIDRIDVIRIVTYVLNANLEKKDNLTVSGFSPGGNLPYRVGAYTDRARNVIVLAGSLKRPAVRFTLAHAAGHLALHRGQNFQDGPLLAGDRPSPPKKIDRLPSPEESSKLLEQEANRFAEELLMPEVLIRKYFQQVFQIETLRHWALAQTTAELLSRGTGFKVTGSDLIVKGREYMALLAAEWSPAGQNLPSLAARFGVSSLAMAFRLQRLGLA